MDWQENLTALHHAVTEADTKASSARQARDSLIRELAADGVTAYRIAKTLGISQTAATKIIRSGGATREPR